MMQWLRNKNKRSYTSKRLLMSVLDSLK